MQVNRYLEDKHFDHIDHALGRPVNPMEESYRNHFAINARNPEVEQFAKSTHWQDNGESGGLHMFSVTQKGRVALSEHLRQIGDPHRLYIVTWQGYEIPQVATSHSKARYSRYLDIREAEPDLTFKQFASVARVRLAG